MDVTCERCSTAYEFDDALVSERGTTVKCTSCGHQFKVRRPQAPGAPERWLVRTIDGRELEFRALRELQAAIAQALITRDDVLSRGGSRPRRLGSIAELEPFFTAAATGGQPTNLGLGPHAPPRSRMPQHLGTPAPPVVVRNTDVSVAIPLPGGGIQDPPSVDEETAIMQHATRPSVPPQKRSNPPPAGTPLPGVVVGPAGAPPPPVGESTAYARYDEVTRAAYGEVLAIADSTRDPPRPATPPPAAVRALLQDDWTGTPASSGPPIAELSPAAFDRPSVTDRPSTAAAPISEPAVSSDAPPPPATPVPGSVRISYTGDEHAYAEPRFSGVVSQPRPGAARWIVGLFVAGMVVLAFSTVGRKLLVSSSQPKGAGDARVASLLTEGEKSLLEGDLELAKEQFDKASVLAERDARVVADLARLAAARADVDWLRARLLAPDDPEQGTVRRELEQGVQRAKRAADQAAEVAPNDPVVARSRIDALRLAGDLEGARKLVGAVSGASSQPDNALVLAELDLAESKPDWSTVQSRLRTAVGGEGNLGRARALLVYALARSSDIAGAKAELERLKSLPRPHPLVGALTGYIARVDRAVDVSALPDATSKARADKAATTGAPAATGAPAPTGAVTPPTPSPRDRTPPPEYRPTPPPDPGVPLNPGPVDTSDLPGVKTPPPPTPPPSPPPANPPPTPAPPPTNTLPPGVDTSDLPGFK